MFARQSRAMFSLLMKQGVSPGAVPTMSKIQPSTQMTLLVRNYHNLQKTPMIMKCTKFSRVMPWFVLGGVGAFGIMELWERKSFFEDRPIFLHAACAGVEKRSREGFLNHYCLEKTFEEIKKMEPEELDDVIKLAMGVEYGVTMVHTYLLQRAAILEVNMRVDMDIVVDDDDYTKRPEQWEVDAIDNDAKEPIGGAVGGQEMYGRSYWLPREYDVLRCVWNGKDYSYFIGRRFKILVELETSKDLISGKELKRPIDLVGISQSTFKQYRPIASAYANGVADYRFNIRFSTTDHIKKTIGGLRPFCPQPKKDPKTDTDTQTDEASDKSKPTIPPNSPQHFWKTVPQRHPSTPPPPRK